MSQTPLPSGDFPGSGASERLTESPSNSRSHGRYPIYLPLMIFINIMWGAAFPITKPGLVDFPPATFAFLRFVLAALILVPMVFLLWGSWHFDRRTWKLVALGGFMGFSMTQLGQNWGLALSTASDISILAAIQPLTITLVAALFLGERPDRTSWLGFLISLIGICVVIGINPFEIFNGAGTNASTSNDPSSSLNPFGRILGGVVFLVGTIGSGVYSVVNRRLVQHNDSLELVGGAVIWGMLGLAPFSGFEVASRLGSGGSGLDFNGWVILGIVYSAVGVTVIGFLALTWSLRQVPVAKIAVLYYLQPVSGVLLSWLLGDRLDLSFIIGSLLILAGVFVAEHWGKIKV